MSWLQKAVVFLLTFMSYAAMHALREGWSYSKSATEKEFGIDATFMGVVDALYLVFYTVGMVVLGSLMHRVSLRFYVIGGLAMASIAYTLWVVIYALTDFYHPALMTVLMCVNGFFQATGWPGLMAIFSLWFAEHKKGLLMGLWALNSNVGNIIAQGLLNVLGDHGISFEWNFILTGALGLVVALLMVFFLKQKPDQKSQELEHSLIDTRERESTPSNKQITASPGQPQGGNQSQSPPESASAFKYGILSVLCFPRVPNYVFSYACLKGCIYGLLFWLPSILDDRGGKVGDQKGYISVMFDIGAVIGAILVGYLADRFNKRALVLTPSLLLSAVVMFMVSFALGDTPWPYYMLLLLLGTFISGPYNMIGTLIAIDIGNNIKEKGSVAKVSSLIQGFAALFTTIEMVAIPYIDMKVIFYLFAGEGLVATLLLLPLFIQEMKHSREEVVKE